VDDEPRQENPRGIRLDGACEQDTQSEPEQASTESGRFQFKEGGTWSGVSHYSPMALGPSYRSAQ
jgi:hypothetical protein